MTKEHKRKIGLANSRIMKKKWQNPKYRKMMKKVQKGHKFSDEQKQKVSERMKGNKLNLGRCNEKAGNWRGGITPENMKIRAGIEFGLWREAVFARDNWTCQKYGIKGGKLHTHHIQNFSSHTELRFAIDNGITLSEKAHREFHKKYGKENNTKEQLNEFLND